MVVKTGTFNPYQNKDNNNSSLRYFFLQNNWLAQIKYENRTYLLEPGIYSSLAFTVPHLTINVSNQWVTVTDLHDGHLLG